MNPGEPSEDEPEVPLAALLARAWIAFAIEADNAAEAAAAGQPAGRPYAGLLPYAPPEVHPSDGFRTSLIDGPATAEENEESLAGLLGQALTSLTAAHERGSRESVPLGANFLRVIDGGWLLTRPRPCRGSPWCCTAAAGRTAPDPLPANRPSRRGRPRREVAAERGLDRLGERQPRPGLVRLLVGRFTQRLTQFVLITLA